MATQAEDALQNGLILNKMFSDGLAPINNFYAQSIQQNFAKEAQLREQAFRQAEQEKSLASNKEIARMAEEAAAARQKAELEAQNTLQTKLIDLRTQAEAQVKTHDLAMSLRASPDTQQIVGDLKKYPIGKDGDSKLVEDYTSMRTPQVAEKIDTQKVIALNKAIGSTIQSLNTYAVDPVQARSAIQGFLADPTVAKTLIDKGGLTAKDLGNLAVTGDFNKVYDAIQKASKGYFYGTNDSRLASLWSAFASARAAASGNTPEQVAKANYLQTQLALRNKVLGSANIQSEDAFKQINSASSFAPTAPASIKLPPPPGGIPTPVPVPVPTPVPTVGPAPFAGQGMLPGMGGMVQNMSMPMDPGPANFQAPSPIQRDVNADALRQFLMGGQSRFDNPLYNAGNLQLPQYNPQPLPGPF